MAAAHGVHLRLVHRGSFQEERQIGCVGSSSFMEPRNRLCSICKCKQGLGPWVQKKTLSQRPALDTKGPMSSYIKCPC